MFEKMSQMTVLSVYKGKHSVALENGKYGARVRDQGAFGRLPCFIIIVKQRSLQQSGKISRRKSYNRGRQ